MLGESYPMSIILSGMLGKISRLKLRLLISRAVCIPIDIWNLIWTNLTKNPNTLCNIRSTFISISWFCRNRHFRQFGDTSGEQSKRMEHYSIFCTWLASDGIEKVLLTKKSSHVVERLDPGQLCSPQTENKNSYHRLPFISSSTIMGGQPTNPRGWLMFGLTHVGPGCHGQPGQSWSSEQ